MTAMTAAKHIRSLGRRETAKHLEAATNGRTVAGPHHAPNPKKGKKPWTPIREACSIVAIFSHRRDDGVWAINPDRETRQERKAARSMIRFAGGKVGVK